RRRKTAEVAAGATHKFVAKRPAQQISIQVHDEQGKPLKTRPYKVHLVGKVLKGTTDGDGVVTIDLPPNAREARLEIDDMQPDHHPRRRIEGMEAARAGALANGGAFGERYSRGKPELVLVLQDLPAALRVAGGARRRSGPRAQDHLHAAAGSLPHHAEESAE